MTFYEEAKPVYSCYHYKDDFYKIVKFKRSNFDGIPSVVRDQPSENDKAGDRFLASLSRSRSSVLQYALSNEWDFFFTGTIDGSRHDRFNLDSFITRFTQFIRDLRKKHGCRLLYLLVPEKHQDGAWHVHGLLNGLPDGSTETFDRLAQAYLDSHGFPSRKLSRLVEKGYLNWLDYADKFGHCSLGYIKDPVKVSFYISKYITKELGENIRGVGSHMYFASRGLRKAVKDGDAYFQSAALDDCLTHDYDFCATGHCRLPWHFVAEMFDGVETEGEGRAAPPSEFLGEPITVSTDWLYEQMNIFDLETFGGV